MDNAGRRLLRAWREPQGQRDQSPEGNFPEEVDPWSANSFPGRERGGRRLPWLKTQRGQRSVVCRLVSVACGQDVEGPRSEVRLVLPQRRAHAEGAKEVGLCPGGTGEPWEGLNHRSNGNDTFGLHVGSALWEECGRCAVGGQE